MKSNEGEGMRKGKRREGWGQGGGGRHSLELVKSNLLGEKKGEGRKGVEEGREMREVWSKQGRGGVRGGKEITRAS